MEFSNNKIAVLLATYNGEQYISMQIESLLSQTYENFICYIHDDGSSDGTIGIIKKYKLAYPNKIKIIEAPPAGGARNNFMYLLSLVKETYISFCDQDDLWTPEKLSELMSKMKDIEEEHLPCAVFSDLKITDENLNIISNSYFDYSGKNPNRLYYKQILIQNFVPGCAMLINRKAVDIALMYKDINNIFMHDWWTLLICSLFGKIGRIDEPLILYRQHGDNSVGADKKVSLIEVMQHIYQAIFRNRVQDIKKRISYPRLFARELCCLPSLKEEDKIFLIELRDIQSKSKFYRIRFYQKNKLYRNNHRNWLMLLYV